LLGNGYGVVGRYERRYQRNLPRPLSTRSSALLGPEHTAEMLRQIIQTNGVTFQTTVFMITTAAGVHKFFSRLKILGARGEASAILKAHKYWAPMVQNLVVWATWPLSCMHLFITVRS